MYDMRFAIFISVVSLVGLRAANGQNNQLPPVLANRRGFVTISPPTTRADGGDSSETKPVSPSQPEQPDDYDYGGK